MFDKVIVPLDGSTTAEVALPYAEEFTGRMGTELVLLFVKEPQDYRSEYILQCYMDNIAKIAREAATLFLAESGVTELQVSTKILTGSPADQIIDFAESQGDCLIIMASHGQSGVGTRWTLGSVADKVVRAVNTPVGLIRANRDKPAVRGAIRLNRILAPVDGSKVSEASLPYVKEAARKLKAEVIFLEILKTHFVHAPSMELQIKDLKAARSEVTEYLDSLVQDFQKSGIAARQEIIESWESVSDEINRFTELNQIDLTIMATHGWSGPRRWVMGSVASNVLREGNTPIMMIRSTGPFKD